MKKILLLSILGLSECHVHIVPPSVALTLFPDGSGYVACVQVAPTKYERGDGATAEGLFAGTHGEEAVTFTAKLVAASFRSVDDLKLADISFTLAKEQGCLLLKVTVPTRPDAAWYKLLGTKQEDRARRGQLRTSRYFGTDTGGAREIERVVILISMPGEITHQRLLGDSTPASWKVGAYNHDPEEGESAEKGKNSAELTIPDQDIRQGILPSIIWEIRTGPVLPKVEKAWRQFKVKSEK